MKPAQKNLRLQESVVRRHVNAWDPIGLIACGAPDDEYDAITHRVLSAFHNERDLGSYAVDLRRFISQHYGSSVRLTEVEVEQFLLRARDEWVEKQRIITE